MRLRDLDLLLAVLIAAMGMLWAGVLKCAAQASLPDPIAIIGILLALLVVFVLPGYTLSEAMFHKRPLETSHRLLLSLALSLAIDIVSGLILNFLPGGLQAITWAGLLGVETVVFALLAASLRRRRIVPASPHQGKHKAPASPHHPCLSLPGASSLHVVPLRRFRLSIYDYIVFGLALLVAILSLEYSARESPMYRGSSQHAPQLAPATAAQKRGPYSGFTQLWMVPSVQDGPLARSIDRHSASSTTSASSPSINWASTCAVRIGVRSFEVTTVIYRVVMRMNGVRVRTWPGVVLAPQQEWDQLVEVKPTSPGNAYVEVRLYRLDQPGVVYRNVHVTLHACSR
jgi:uncharacterized membrane protein